MTLSRGSVFTPLPSLFPYSFFVPSQIQTLDLLFVNVDFIHCQLRDGRREQVMHSLGLAPTPGNAGPGVGTQIGLQYLESAITMWGTAILPATSKWETEALRCPCGSHNITGWLESAVSDTRLCIQVPLTRPTRRPGCMTLHPHQVSAICL